MSRINGKRLLLLALTAALSCPFLTGAAEEDIISGDQLAPEQINYKTVQVESGSFSRDVAASASEYYPLTYHLRFEHSGAKFVEYTVTRGDEVKAGDVLARFVIEGSEVQLTRMKMNLENIERETEQGIIQREEKIAEARVAVAAEKDGYEQEKKRLMLRRLELELEQYTYKQQYSIDRQRADLDELIADREANELLAPVDGVVTDLTYKKPDDAVSTSETLVTIYSTEVMLMRIDNSGGGFRYNMPVTVSVGNNKERVEIAGRVIAADDVIPEEDRLGYAFVQLGEYDEEVMLRNPKVAAKTMYVGNVLLAPRKAITLENGKYYVTKLVDGMVQKRYIEYGDGNTTDVWIMAGAADGDTLVVD